MQVFIVDCEMLFERLAARTFIVCIVVFACCAMVAACTPSLQSGPQRLFTAAEETSLIKQQVGPPDFKFYSASTTGERIKYRNNYIAARMYAMDVAYTEYENALTTERQTVGFVGSSANIALNTAATLVTPTSTKTAISAVAAGLSGTRAAYNDDVLLKNSVDLLQTQMRANRANVAATIFRRMSHDDSVYPLAMALSDLEDYYRAGTMTGGIIKAQSTVSAAEQLAVENKEAAILYQISERPSQVALRNALAPNGIYNQSLAAKIKAALSRDNISVKLGDIVTNPQYGQLADKLAAELGIRY
ncbi:hypothetical protein [Rhizobium sp. BR 249]|uniref:hypothetical protein n=1 Tax=Rhizobium sp. BR 249 TaxID=3040011 RepID=UPI0039BEEEF3